jgi:hypothetical protein
MRCVSNPALVRAKAASGAPRNDIELRVATAGSLPVTARGRGVKVAVQAVSQPLQWVFCKPEKRTPRRTWRRAFVPLYTLTMKVARSAPRISLALRERTGVRETAMAAATCIFRGGADAMAVSLNRKLLNGRAR